MSDSPEMTNVETAGYIRRISLAKSIAEFQALSREIDRRFPLAEATPRLVKVIAIKVERLVRAN